MHLLVLHEAEFIFLVDHQVAQPCLAYSTCVPKATLHTLKRT